MPFILKTLQKTDILVALLGAAAAGRHLPGARRTRPPEVAPTSTPTGGGPAPAAPRAPAHAHVGAPAGRAQLPPPRVPAV